MSAFIVSDKHIQTLVSFYVACNDPLPPDQVGQILLDENTRSVNYRYNETTQPYNFHFVPVTFPEPVEILKAILCLEYQSCETRDWYQSRALEILQVIKNNAIRLLPGYDAATWEIN